MEKLTEICTCDDFTDEPCPRHRVENEMRQVIEEAITCLNSDLEVEERVKLTIQILNGDNQEKMR